MRVAGLVLRSSAPRSAVAAMRRRAGSAEAAGPVRRGALSRSRRIRDAERQRVGAVARRAARRRSSDRSARAARSPAGARAVRAARRDAAVSLSRRDGRRFVHVQRRRGRCPCTCSRDPAVFLVVPTGLTPRRAMRGVSPAGRRTAGADDRSATSAGTAARSSRSGCTCRARSCSTTPAPTSSGATSSSGSSRSPTRLKGEPLELAGTHGTESILYTTLLLFGSTVVAAAATFAAVLWWVARRGRDRRKWRSRDHDRRPDAPTAPRCCDADAAAGCRLERGAVQVVCGCRPRLDLPPPLVREATPADRELAPRTSSAASSAGGSWSPTASRFRWTRPICWSPRPRAASPARWPGAARRIAARRRAGDRSDVAARGRRRVSAGRSRTHRAPPVAAARGVITSRTTTSRRCISINAGVIG